MFYISIYNESINTKLHLYYKAKCTYILKLIIFLSCLYTPDFRMFCISMYNEGIDTKLQLDLRASINLQIEHFFIMVIYTGFLYVLYFRVQ